MGQGLGVLSGFINNPRPQSKDLDAPQWRFFRIPCLSISRDASAVHHTTMPRKEAKGTEKSEATSKLSLQCRQILFAVLQHQGRHRILASWLKLRLMFAGFLLHLPGSKPPHLSHSHRPACVTSRQVGDRVGTQCPQTRTY